MTPLVPLDDVYALEGAACYRLSRPDADSKIGPDLWFATTVQDWANGTAQEAVQVCRRCPVRLECLRVALKGDEQHGIWGGFNFGNAEQKQRARGLMRGAA
jgi:WhiB family redox-sensing transcriptional regulator